MSFVPLAEGDQQGGKKNRQKCGIPYGQGERSTISGLPSEKVKEGKQERLFLRFRGWSCRKGEK